MNIHTTNGRSVTRELPKATWTTLPPRPEDPALEFVYFLYSAGRIKIGYSRGLDGRRKQLRASGPFPPVLLLVIHGDLGTEADFHVRFANDRLHGEWFSLSADLRSYLRARLCDIGRESLQRAEVEFKEYCDGFLAAYKPPLRYKPRVHCEHGMPVGLSCYPCDRARDLAVLDQINNGTYSPPPSCGVVE